MRRNDLQYKEVFIGASKSMKNVRALLSPGEAMYVTTDEKDPRFFESIEWEYPVFQASRPRPHRHALSLSLSHPRTRMYKLFNRHAHKSKAPDTNAMTTTPVTTH